MLTALAGFVSALLAVGALACRWRQVAGSGAAVLCAGILLVAMMAIMEGGRTILALPIGLAPGGLVLSLDPLAAFFLLPVCIAGIAAGLTSQPTPLLPVFAATMVLTVIAGDPVTSLVLGFHSHGGVPAGACRVVPGSLAVAAGGPVCLLAALPMLIGLHAASTAKSAPHRRMAWHARPACWRTDACLERGRP